MAHRAIITWDAQPKAEEFSHLFENVLNRQFRRSPDLSDPRKGTFARTARWQEPIGYKFFTDSNINKILESMPYDKKAITRNRPMTYYDLQPVMMEIFNAYGTNEANPEIKATDADKIDEMVNYLNQLTIDEMTKQNKSAIWNCLMYTNLLDDPNTSRYRTMPENPSAKKAASFVLPYSFLPPDAPLPFAPSVPAKTAAGGSLGANNGGSFPPLFTEPNIAGASTVESRAY